MNRLIEEAVWGFLSKLASRSGARIFQRLRYANTLIQEVVAFAHKVPLQQGKDPQHRRDPLGQKTALAFDQVYELSQSETLAGESEMRRTMYAVLATLATVNKMILDGASDEEIRQETQKLNGERLAFEEHTRRLEQAKA
jgi:hypothetical protein